ncbi:hypothetical protein [Streptomyces cyaneofuscatus]|uniref:hypothetical protein n=1 Tax=Streptomyces cyaneofuscatus TaxID=66883 RepID=UPI003652B5B6
MTLHSQRASALPGPVSAIQLSYRNDQSWWDTGENEPEIWHVSADLVEHETEEIIEHVGDFEFFRADPYETRDLFGVLDGYEGDVAAIAEALLDHSTGHFRDDLDEYAEIMGSGMLLLNSAKLKAEWRGFGLGVVLAGRAIKRLGSGSRGAACYPAPLESADDSDTTHAKAIAALGRTWEQLGFEPYRSGVYVLNLGSVALGEALPALTKRVEDLPQPDLDQWYAARR